MTRVVSRLVMVSHITNRLLKYVPASHSTRTRLINHCLRVAVIIQSSESLDSQSDSKHSHRTKDLFEAAKVVTRVVASLTTRMTQNQLKAVQS